MKEEAAVPAAARAPSSASCAPGTVSSARPPSHAALNAPGRARLTCTAPTEPNPAGIENRCWVWSSRARAVSACQLHPKHAGTPVLSRARLQGAGRGASPLPDAASRKPSSAQESVLETSSKSKEDGRDWPCSRGRQNNKEGDKSLSNGFSLRNTNVSEPWSPPA